MHLNLEPLSIQHAVPDAKAFYLDEYTGDVKPCISDAMLETMQQHDFPPRPYQGLRDVWGGSLMDHLKACARDNAWPDWVAYLAQASKAGIDLHQLGFMLGGAIIGADWPQTIEEIICEAQCRNAKQFVLQSPREGLTMYTDTLRVKGCG